MMIDPIHSEGLGLLVRAHKAGADVWVGIVLGSLIAVTALVTLGIDGAGQPYWSGAGIITGVALLYFSWSKKNDEAQVYEHGLLYQRRGRVYQFRWTEVAHIWQRSVRRSVNFIPVGTFHEYTIETPKGTFVLKGDLSDIEKLGEEVQRRIFKVKMPVAIREYNSGNSVLFGPFGISQRGFTYGRVTIPWSEIKSTSVVNGYFRVDRSGKWLTWANVPIEEIPDFRVLWSIVQEILGTS
jgi:hypothetical protein